ncbi:unnamed protein product [marine sediment metagenome]|uniref:Uncharacterized protein n=1 Tax=marine sediment metagenome TaxID=412755 RepID=X0V8F9_9ZZZZ
MSDGKVLIMGVGGCGSSFLWGLLGDCGLETLGINEWMRWSGIRRAHREGTVDQMEYPKVIKHLGGFLTNLNLHIDQNHWEIEHIFFAVSSYDCQIRETVERRALQRRHLGKSKEQLIEAAKRDYEVSLGKGLIQLIERDHPFTMVRLPRSIKDPKYLYRQLRVVLGDMPYDKFREVHAACVVPKLLKKLDGWE